MEDITEVIEALNRYSRGVHSAGDFNLIVEFCHRIAEVHLRVMNIGSTSRKETVKAISDEAHTCIAKLFLTRNKTGFTLLASSWSFFKRKKTESVELALQHLVNLVRKVVRQQWVENMRTVCPQEWKIRRALRQNTKRSSNYGMFRYCGEMILSLRIPRPDKWKIVPEQMLKEHCLFAFEGNDNLRKMLDKTMSLLRKPDLMYNCIRFGELATIIIEYMAYILISHGFSQDKKIDSDEETFLYNLRQPILNKIKKKIQKTYLRNKKISSETARIYMRALEAFLMDLLQNGETEPHFAYLEELGPESDKKDLSFRHKNRFGYLVTELRNMLREAAKELLERKR